MSGFRVAVSLSALVLACAFPIVASAKTDTSSNTIHPTAKTDLVNAVKSPTLSAYEAAGREGGASAGLHAPALNAQVMAVLAAPDTSAPSAGGSYAAGRAPAAASPTAPAGSDATTVTTPPAGGDTAILDLPPLNRLGGLATGLSIGLGAGDSGPAIPDEAALDAQTAAAVVQAFRTPPGTADQAASDAAGAAQVSVGAPATPATSGDPALDERITLARTVFKVDGTDALIRHFIETQHMKLIIAEVARHIEIDKLSETDKYRLSAIASSAMSELEDKVLNLDARIEAGYLSKPDLMLLIVAYDNDAQRKLTQLRLGDTGKTDRAAALDITMAQYQIVKGYEAQ